MTVWALPSKDLQTRPTSAPAAFASIAARSPAPPAPMTSTSCGRTCGFDGAAVAVARVIGRLEADRGIGDDAQGEKPDVDVRERDREEARPGPRHVVAIQPGELLPEGVPRLGSSRA